MEDVIFIDNSPISYVLDGNNSLPIKTWLDDPNDIELYKYLRLLEHMSSVSDVRSFIKKVVHRGAVDFEKVESILQSKPPTHKRENPAPKSLGIQLPKSSRESHFSVKRMYNSFNGE